MSANYRCGEGHEFAEPVMLMEDYYDRGETLYGCPICGEGFDEIEEIDEIDEDDEIDENEEDEE